MIKTVWSNLNPSMSVSLFRGCFFKEIMKRKIVEIAIALIIIIIIAIIYQMDYSQVQFHDKDIVKSLKMQRVRFDQTFL